MNLLLARNDDGHWHKVGVWKATKAGRFNCNAPHSTESLAGYALRTAAKFFAAEPMARDVDYDLSGHLFRVTRY